MANTQIEHFKTELAEMVKHHNESQDALNKKRIKSFNKRFYFGYALFVIGGLAWLILGSTIN